MTSAFPNSIDQFTPKRDNYDVNYANDINRLQDAVSAIEQTLGALVTTVTDLSIEVTTDEQVEAAFEQQTTTKFKSLGDLITWIQNGYHIPAAYVTGQNFLIKPSDIQSDLPTMLKMDKPNVNQDPYGMYNGSGLTLTKSGFWLIHGFVRFDVGDTRSSGSGDNSNWNSVNNGSFQASIDDGSNWHQGTDRKSVFKDGGYYPNMFLNPVRMQWFNAGTKVYLRAAHNSGQKQHVFNASLGAVRLRGSGAGQLSSTP